MGREHAWLPRATASAGWSAPGRSGASRAGPSSVRRKRQIQAGIGGALALVLDRARHHLAARRVRARRRPGRRWPAAPAPGRLLGPGHRPEPGRHRPAADRRVSRAPASHTLTIKTNQGDIEAADRPQQGAVRRRELQVPRPARATTTAPPATSSTPTHKTLTCGDPKGTGTGSPSYQFANEDWCRPTPLGTRRAGDRRARPLATPLPTAGTELLRQGHDRHGQHRRRNATAGSSPSSTATAVDLSAGVHGGRHDHQGPGHRRGGRGRRRGGRQHRRAAASRQAEPGSDDQTGSPCAPSTASTRPAPAGARRHAVGRQRDVLTSARLTRTPTRGAQQ